MNRRKALKLTTLTGTVIFTGFSSTLTSCTESNELTWKPVILNENQIEIIEHIANHIIPETETPGAKDVGVSRFIDLILQDVYTEDEKSKFLSGIDDFDKNCIKAYNKSFISLDFDQKNSYFLSVKESSFFTEIKNLSLDCYFHSEQGIKQNYNYLPVPGKFIGCDNMPENGKVWRGGDI